MEDSRNDNVGGKQKCTLEVVTPAIQDQEINHKCGDKQTNGLEQGKVQGHILVHTPAQDDDERSDEDGYIINVSKNVQLNLSRE